jgi:hypothetical protein
MANNTRDEYGVRELAPALQSDGEPPHSKVPWPHAPTHRLIEADAYMVTAGTYQKQTFFSRRPPVAHRAVPLKFY